MAITVTATLLTASNPQPVQVILAGTTAGQGYQIYGWASDGSTWNIPGGSGVSAGSQIVVTDTRAALNSIVTYTAIVAGVAYTSGSVTIAYSGLGIFQSLDSKSLCSINIVGDNQTDYKTGQPRVGIFPVAGRNGPAIRIDVASYDSDQWVVETTTLADGATLKAILLSGVPIVRRLVAGVRDLDTVVIAQPSAWTDQLLDNGTDVIRRWTITVQEIDDPQPSVGVSPYSWNDFDTAMASRLWSYYTQFASTAGWTATNGTLSQQTSGGYSDNGDFARVTVTTSNTAAALNESANNTAATPSSVWTVTCRVKGTAGLSASAQITWSGGTVAAGTAVTLTGSWQQVSVTATAPAGTTGFKAGASVAATGVVSGNTLDIDAFTVSGGSVVPVGTFDELWSTWDQFDAEDWALLE